MAYVTTHTSGIDSQNRTDTPTSAGAEISFVIGGPSPQITTTPAITAPATAGDGSPAWPSHRSRPRRPRQLGHRVLTRPTVAAALRRDLPAPDTPRRTQPGTGRTTWALPTAAGRSRTLGTRPTAAHP